MCIACVFLISVALHVIVIDENDYVLNDTTLNVVCSATTTINAAYLIILDTGLHAGCKTVKRKRKFVGNIFAGYGNYYMKRAYHMIEEDYGGFITCSSRMCPPVRINRERQRK